MSHFRPSVSHFRPNAIIRPITASRSVDYTNLPCGENDGLPTAPVGAWVREKYIRVWMYDQLFSTGMKNEWEERVYVDLFAGAGYSRLGKTGKILHGSPLLALDVADRFDRYIFCEQNRRYLEALETRVGRLAPDVKAHFVLGDADKRIGEILGHIPRASQTHKVLTFVFVDPFSVELRFTTIQQLATRFTDFLILLALGMDANRNIGTYMKPGNRRIEEFVNDPEWRSRWKVAEQGGRSFTYFLASEYAAAMERLGYRKTSMDRMVEVRSDDRNLPLYYLAFFSRHERGYRFWDQVRKYSTAQTDLGLEGR